MLKKKKKYLFCATNPLLVYHTFSNEIENFSRYKSTSIHTCGAQPVLKNWELPAQHNYLHVGTVTVRYCSNRHDGLRRYAVQFYGCNRNGCTSGNRAVFAAHCLYDLPRGAYYAPAKNHRRRTSRTRSWLNQYQTRAPERGYRWYGDDVEVLVLQQTSAMNSTNLPSAFAIYQDRSSWSSFY